MFLAMFLTLFMSTNSSCLNGLLKDMNLFEDDENYELHCSKSHPNLKSAWSITSNVVRMCPEAGQLISYDATKYEESALTNAVKVCLRLYSDTVINTLSKDEVTLLLEYGNDSFREKFKNKYKNKEEDSFDYSLLDTTELAPPIPELTDEEIEQRYRKGIANFKKNKAKIRNRIYQCLRKYAHDPSSVSIASISYLYTDGYTVAYRAKNAFGALILDASVIELGKTTCKIISNSEEE